MRALFEGHGYEVTRGRRRDLPGMHRRFAATLAEAWCRIRTIQEAAAAATGTGPPHWPLIILRTPKGWTGPDIVDGVQMRGTWRAHQVPLSGVKDNPEHLAHARDLAALLPAGGPLRRRRPARRARLPPTRWATCG